MKTEEKLAFQKGILEGLKLVEKMYKYGDLNPGNLIKLMEIHDDQLNYLEYVLELEQKRQPITSALPDTNVGNMAPPRACTTQHPTVKEPVDARENWINGFFFGLISSAMVYMAYELLFILFNAEYVVR